MSFSPFDNNKVQSPFAYRRWKIHLRLQKMEKIMPGSVYRKRNPQNSRYYQCVEDNFETFEQIYEKRFERQYGFPRPYVGQVMLR